MKTTITCSREKWGVILLLATCLTTSLLAAPGDYQAVFEFTQSATVGGRPTAAPIYEGGVLYGMTPYGGVSNWGVVYKVDLVDSNYTTLHAFTGPDGKTPLGSLLAYGTNLYGMTSRGGTHHSGVIFAMDTNGLGLTVLHHFDGEDVDNGALPWGSLVEDSGILYGMTYNGGVTNRGVVFSISPDGSGYTNLHVFLGGPGEGKHPKSDLLVDGGQLYAVTSEGGTNNVGVVFTMALDGSGYANLYEFSGSDGDGQFPSGRLIKKGNYLYGTAIGGTDNAGVLFALSTSGGTENMMWYFSGEAGDGATPYAGLLDHDTKLYGLTRYGGSNSVGVLFSLGASQTNQFVWGDGGEPIGDLLALGDMAYGTTFAGGVSNRGTLFQFEMDTNDGATAWCALTWIENGALADTLAGDMPTDRLWVRHNTAGGAPLSSFIGYGLTDNFDDSTWTWLTMTNYGILGSDYEFTGILSRASAGDYVVAAKFIKGSHVYYTTGMGNWGDWSTALYATNEWTVVPITAPSNTYARYVSTNDIDVLFEGDGSHWVTVFQKAGAAPGFDLPVDGTEYFVGDTYAGQGECIYRGTAHLYSDTGLVESATYSYALYAENWAYYSTGSTASASTDPANDDDGDRMPNQYEVDNGLDPGLAADGLIDTDGDEQMNWHEWVAGTELTNENSLLEITGNAAQSGTTYAFTWSSVTSKYYSVWRGTNLVQGLTDLLISNIAATVPENSYTDTVTGVGHYYYRVEVEQ